MSEREIKGTALRTLQAARPGENVWDIISDAYNKHGNLIDAAVELGISVPTLRKWVECGGGVYEEETQRRLVFPASAADLKEAA